MTKNTLSDLNNHLFAQLERLSDETIDQEDLNKEIERSKAISTVAKTIIENAMSLLIKLIAEFFISYYLPNPLSFNSFNASALKS